MSQVSLNQAITLDQVITGLLPELINADNSIDYDRFLLWPPDLFALTSSILSMSGIYHYLLSPPNDRKCPGDIYDDTWKNITKTTSLEWRRNLSKVENSEDFLGKNLAPETVKRLWTDFLGIFGDKKIFEKILYEDTDFQNDDNWHAYKALMALHVICDSTCCGWGVRNADFDDTSPEPSLNYLKCSSVKSEAQKYAEHLLKEKGTLSNINSNRCRILPKRHTPSVGMTLRSFSESLAYHRSSVDVKWYDYGDKNNELVERLNRDDKTNELPYNEQSISVLLLPWPLKLNSTDFKIVHPKNLDIAHENAGFFTYESSAKIDEVFENYLEYCIKQAKKHTHAVDMIIFPEAFLNSIQAQERLESILKRHKVSCYISGLNHKDRNCGFYKNKVVFNMADTSRDEANNIKYNSGGDSVEQEKHHRWRLNRSQIVKYNLGNIFPPEKYWWEGIEISRRRVSFINISQKLTICPLICEDLARQDPIADLIRTVGPSLVVTILMDGAQTLNRWSAKYASVLAEDPGCSVITLTSYGMVKQSQRLQHQASSSIALFCDGDGNYEEIELDDDSLGILLNLYVHPKKEILPDGRDDHNYTYSLLFGGFHQISIKPELKHELSNKDFIYKSNQDAI